MAVVSWSSEARQDLKRIRDYYRNRSPGHARDVLGRIYEAVSRLETFPRMGRQVPELESDTFREVVVEKYRVVYLLEQEEGPASVAVLTVVHSRQDLFKKLARRN